MQAPALVMDASSIGVLADRVNPGNQRGAKSRGCTNGFRLSLAKIAAVVCDRGPSRTTTRTPVARIRWGTQSRAMARPTDLLWLAAPLDREDRSTLAYGRLRSGHVRNRPQILVGLTGLARCRRWVSLSNRWPALLARLQALGSRILGACQQDPVPLQHSRHRCAIGAMIPVLLAIADQLNAISWCGGRLWNRLQRQRDRRHEVVDSHAGFRPAAIKEMKRRYADGNQYRGGQNDCQARPSQRTSLAGTPLLVQPIFQFVDKGAGRCVSARGRWPSPSHRSA